VPEIDDPVSAPASETATSGRATRAKQIAIGATNLITLDSLLGLVTLRKIGFLI
jgi:hypothetical protein